MPAPARDWLLRSQHPTQVERIEAYFCGHGFDPHRHDTYAIGRTLSGVQSFRYRQALRHSVPGGTLVLHPDELHDGHAGTDEGFRYRMIYVEPALIQQVLGGQPLPFIAGGLSDDPRLFAATSPFVRAMEQGFEPLEEDDALFDLAHALQAVAAPHRGRRVANYPAAERARAYINDCFAQAISLDDLALASGLDRWRLTRDFRLLYGTSPYRYVTLRRLACCRRLLRMGMSLADAAASAGFADQSHMTRQFAANWGQTPGRWLAMQT